MQTFSNFQEFAQKTRKKRKDIVENYGRLTRGRGKEGWGGPGIGPEKCPARQRKLPGRIVMRV
jgi:hypothetical protein